MKLLSRREARMLAVLKQCAAALGDRPAPDFNQHPDYQAYCAATDLIEEIEGTKR